MPIQNLSDLSGVYRAVEGMTSPLAEIEKRRAQRKAESQKDAELGIEAVKAQASQQAAYTAAAKEQRAAEDAAELKAEMERLQQFGPTAQPGTPEYLQQKYIYASEAIKSKNPDVVKLGNEMIKEYQNDINAAAPGSPQVGAQRAAGQVELDTARAIESRAKGKQAEAEADVATAGLEVKTAEPGEATRVWADGIIAELNPSVMGIGGWSAAEQRAYREELAAYLNDVRKRYANSGLDELQIRAIAKNNWMASKGLGGAKRIETVPERPIGGAAQGPQGPSSPQVPPEFDIDFSSGNAM